VRTIVLIVVLVPWSLAAQQIFIISDLHFGYGKASNAVHPAEDFRWTADFAKFLEHLDTSTNSSATLVFAGDAFELWEADPKRCANGKTLGCTSSDATKRIKEILSAHDADMKELRTFLDKGSNRLVIVPGNHDAALLFPDVAAEVKKRIGPRVEVASDGYWVANKRVLVEHGHQFDQTNSYPSWPKPFIKKNGTTYIHRPFGEQFVREFFDPHEEKLPIIDNFSDTMAGISYARKAGKATLTQGLREFLRLYFRDTALQQKLDVLERSNATMPKWNIEETRKKRNDVFFVNTLPPSATTDVLKEAVGDDHLAAAFSDDDIEILCNSRYLLWIQNGKPEDWELCVAPDLARLGAKLLSFMTHRDVMMHAHLAGTLRRLRKKNILTAADPVLYVYGHTHAATKPKPINDLNVTVVNTGAWQRIMSAAAVKARGIKPENVFQVLTLEDGFPPCYSFVTVNGTEASLQYWTRASDRTYSVTPTCAERE
jgi:UDP-2,3-diacylglucosamine pyrophosphatase LpxH